MGEQQAFNRAAVLAAAKTRGSFYLYDESIILRQIAALKAAFGGVRFLYSVKANPCPAVVNTVLGQGFGADAASLYEVHMAQARGVAPADIQYSAPGKTAADIEGALGVCTLVADSLAEVQRIEAAAARRDVVVDIGVRINPAFGFAGGAGTPSKFGMDETQALAAAPQWKSLAHVRITGIHVHLRSQELHSTVLAQYYANVLQLALRVQAALGTPLSFINLGSGIGIPYAEQDAPLDVAALGTALQAGVQAMRTALPQAVVYVETGRYVVGQSGVYATTVVDKKVSCGKTFVLLHNTLNGFIRPSLAQLVAAYSAEENPAGTEPLFTAKNAFAFVPLVCETETETVTLAGNLCTAADVVAKDITLPKLAVGDVVVITAAGSYAAALSPMQFSHQTPPEELFLTKDGTVVSGAQG